MQDESHASCPAPIIVSGTGNEVGAATVIYPLQAKHCVAPRKGGILLLLFIFIGGTSSTIWSWQGLKPMLLHQAAFESLCTRSSKPVDDVGEATAKCIEQDIALTEAWKLGTTFPMIGSLALGVVFDRIGSKFTGMFGQILFLSGLLSFALAGNMWKSSLYYCGFLCIGVAQVPIYNACVSVSNLFPKCPNFVIAILSSAGDLSYNVPAVLSMLSSLYIYMTGNSEAMGSRVAFAFYGICFCGLQIITAAAALPKKEFPKLSLTSPTTEVENDDTTHEEDPLISSQICSHLFWLQALYFVVGFLRVSYVNGAIGSILGEMNSGGDEASSYLRIFLAIQRLGILFSLGFGFFADRTSLYIAMALQNTCALISCVGFFCLPYLWFQPISFLAFQFFSSFLFSQAFCWIREIFGFTHINMLFALISAPAGMLGFAIAKVLDGLKLAQREANFWHNLFFLLVTPFLYVVPWALRRHTLSVQYIPLRQNHP